MPNPSTDGRIRLLSPLNLPTLIGSTPLETHPCPTCQRITHTGPVPSAHLGHLRRAVWGGSPPLSKSYWRSALSRRTMSSSCIQATMNWQFASVRKFVLCPTKPASSLFMSSLSPCPAAAATAPCTLLQLMFHTVLSIPAYLQVHVHLSHALRQHDRQEHKPQAFLRTLRIVVIE